MTTDDREKFDAAVFDAMSLATLLQIAAEGLRSDFRVASSHDEIGLAFGAAARVIEAKLQAAHLLVDGARK